MESIGDRLNALPEEVFINIICKLGGADIKSCKLVCRKWKSAIENSVECCDKLVLTLNCAMIYQFNIDSKIDEYPYHQPQLFGQKYCRFKVSNFNINDENMKYKKYYEYDLHPMIAHYSSRRKDGIKSIIFETCKFRFVEDFNKFIGPYQHTLENIDLRLCKFYYHAQEQEENIDIHEFPFLKTVTLAQTQFFLQIGKKSFFFKLFKNCKSLEFIDFHATDYYEDFFQELILQNRSLKTVRMNLAMFRSIQNEEFCRKLVNYRIKYLAISNFKPKAPSTDLNLPDNFNYLLESQKSSLISIYIEPSLPTEAFEFIVKLPNLRSLKLQHSADIENFTIPHDLRNESLRFLDLGLCRNVNKIEKFLKCFPKIEQCKLNIINEQLTKYMIADCKELKSLKYYEVLPCEKDRRIVDSLFREKKITWGFKDPYEP